MLSTRSQKILKNAHINLQRLAIDVANRMQISVYISYRGELEQNEAFKKGTSNLKFPDSKHNKKPSLAIDVAPLKNGTIDWNDEKLFIQMRAEFGVSAKELEIKINPLIIFKNGSKDYPHIELA